MRGRFRYVQNRLSDRLSVCCRWLLLVGVGVSLALVGPVGGAAAAVSVLAPVRLSGASPFAPGCVARTGGISGSDVQRGAAVEPSLAVAPTDPRLIVAAYQQDRLKDGSSLGNVVSVSRDGGRTFDQELLPGTTVCDGGTPVGPEKGVSVGTDPVASIGPDGVAYVSTQRPDGYVVSRSRDLHTWATASAAPTPLWVRGTPGSLLFFDDKDTLVADPLRAGHVDLAWDQFTGIQPASIVPGGSDLGDLRISNALVRSGDGGRSWSRRSTPNLAIPLAYAQLNPTLVGLPNGELVLIYDFFSTEYAIGLPAQPGEILATHSSDGGASWSAPVTIATVPPSGAGVYDPGTGACVRAGADCGASSDPGIVGATAGPDGTIDVVWQRNKSTRSGKIMLARSTDGGRHWSPPTTVVQASTQVFLPQAAVMPDGTIGVSYDAFRAYTPGSPHVYTDVWLRTSNDRGLTFPTVAHVAGPFDIRAAPMSETETVGRFLGDYQGMVALPDGFGLDYAASAPMATDGPSNIFFSRAIITSTTTDHRR